MIVYKWVLKEPNTGILMSTCGFLKCGKLTLGTSVYRLNCTTEKDIYCGPLAAFYRKKDAVNVIYRPIFWGEEAYLYRCKAVIWKGKRALWTNAEDTYVGRRIALCYSVKLLADVTPTEYKKRNQEIRDARR